MTFQAVLFDCDGVLVDSESITNQVLVEVLGEMGWQLTLAECLEIFVGKAVMDEAALIEKNSGQQLTEVWMQLFRERRNAALTRDLQAVPNIHAAVEQLHRHFDGRIACASGADRFKIQLQLEKVGLTRFFENRIFSGHEMPRSKPAPDVYLAAALALGIAPQHCAVVEDTVTGVCAGVAAGATVYGYCPEPLGSGTAERLRSAGAAHIFADMAELAGLLGA